MADLDLSTKYISTELRRAEIIARGPPQPGKDETVKTFDTFKFPAYHEPEERWPFLSDPILEKIRKHGNYIFENLQILFMLTEILSQNDF